MAENSLVRWDEAYSLGPIPGTEWVSPVGNTALKHMVEHDAMFLANDQEFLSDYGRRQQLIRRRFPEGYDFLEIIDTATGEVLKDEESGTKYVVTDQGDFQKTGRKPGVGQAPYLDYRLPLDADRDVVNLVNLRTGGTRTIIQPSTIDEWEPDSATRRNSQVTINPDQRFLHIRAEGQLHGRPDIATAVDLVEKDANIKLNLLFSHRREGFLFDHLSLDFNHLGRLERIQVLGYGLLKIVGYAFRKPPTSENKWVEIADKRERQRLGQAAAKLAGVTSWHALDLRRTGMELYARLGQRHLDPTAALQFKNKHLPAVNPRAQRDCLIAAQLNGRLQTSFRPARFISQQA